MPCDVNFLALIELALLGHVATKPYCLQACQPIESKSNNRKLRTMSYCGR